MANRLKYAFYCYIFLMVLLIICKPKIMFQNNGAPKQFGTGGEEKTIFPFWLAAILGAIFSYIASINIIFRMDHSEPINKNNQNDYFHQDKKYPMIISGGDRQTYNSSPTPTYNMTGGGSASGINGISSMNGISGVNSIGVNNPSEMNNANDLRQNLYYQQPQYGGYYQYNNIPNNNLHWNKAWN